MHEQKSRGNMRTAVEDRDHSWSMAAIRTEPGKGQLLNLERNVLKKVKIKRSVINDSIFSQCYSKRSSRA